MSTTTCTHCTDLEAGLCGKHQATITILLGTSDRSLAAFYVELNVALQPGRAGNDEPSVTMSRAKRLPLSGEARAAQEDILAVVTGLEAQLRSDQGWMPAPSRGREGPRLQGACAVLLAHVAEWTSTPTRLEDADAVLGVAKTARRALGLTAPRLNTIDLPCPHCRARTLRRPNGQDDTACMSCAAVLTAQQLDDLLDPPIEREAA